YFYDQFLTGSVELQCPSQTPGLETEKLLCKLIHTDCFPIVGKSKNRKHSRRIIMTNGNSSGTFSVTINDLKRQDSGVYVCGTRILDKNASVKTIQLQVVEGTRRGVLVSQHQPALVQNSSAKPWPDCLLSLSCSYNKYCFSFQTALNSPLTGR
uniref:Immunoglobulin V-set domain-containing protein n=1 Tax=Naja naja TaxID=35670 RepID=A0A8C7DWV5_NAJNA